MNFHKEAKCAKCKYFFGIPSAMPPKVAGGPSEIKMLGGQCRRYVPTVGFVLIMEQRVVQQKVQTAEGPEVQIVPKIERVTSPPQVMAEFWCGEFEPMVL